MTDTAQQQDEPMEAQETERQAPDEPQGESIEEKYAKLKREARKWEELAKRDKDAAQAWRDQQEAGKSDIEKLTEQVTALTKERDALKQAEEQRLWAEEVAAAKHVPVSVLRGSTKEEIEAHAEAILSSGLSMHAGIPDKGEAEPPSITAEQIMAVTDPAERVRLMAKHADKFNVRR